MFPLCWEDARKIIERSKMLTNYLKVFVNNLYRQKIISVINVLGLSVGFACVFLIGLYVRYELTFDQMHPDFERIYMVPVLNEELGNRGESNYYWFVPDVLKKIPELEQAGRLMPVSLPLAGNGKIFDEKNIRLIDPSIFELFDFEWIAGNPNQALDEPFSLVLTEATARRYFGSDDPMGKPLLLNTHLTAKVTGVVKELNPHSHLTGDIFTPISTLTKAYGEDQFQNRQTNFRSYIKLKEGVDIEDIQESIRSVVSERAQAWTPPLDDAIDFIRLDQIHLSNKVDKLASFTQGRSDNLFVFSTIAICILLVACINYNNLTTAQVLKRIKEVSMRKTVGANRRQLVNQFLSESVLVSLVSAIFALTLVEAFLPIFSDFLEITNIYDSTTKWVVIALLLLGSIGVGVVAGFYPALFVSNYQQGKTLTKGFGARLGVIVRNSLVVFQFSIAIALIVAVSVVYAQLRFSRQFDVGFNKEQVVTFNGSGSTNLVYYWESFKKRLLENPNIQKAAITHRLPGEEFGVQDWVVRHRETDRLYQTHLMPVGYDFIEVFEIELLAGRSFDSSRNNDLLPNPQQEKRDGAFILNQSSAAQFGWRPEEAVGQHIELGSEGEFAGEVVGVVKDTYYESTYSISQPMVYFLGANFLPYLHGVVKISNNNVQDTFEHIQRSWKAVIPEHPLSIQFFDQGFDRIYRKNDQQGQIVGFFAFVSIAIACFGLFGLARFNAERRIKEIGIRKVHGSSVWQVVVLLTKDFSKLVLLSNLIAWPVAYFAMSRWLEQFAYRIDLTPLIFISSGLIALCIAWVTVGGTAAKAASQKPVLALRYE